MWWRRWFYTFSFLLVTNGTAVTLISQFAFVFSVFFFNGKNKNKRMTYVLLKSRKEWKIKWAIRKLLFSSTSKISISDDDDTQQIKNKTVLTTYANKT